MIPISVDEIKEHWHGFCERRGVLPAARDAGDRKIEEDPEYWADQTMADLLEAIAPRRES